MKRFVSFILALILLTAFSAMAEVDISVMSIDELYDLQKQVEARISELEAQGYEAQPDVKDYWISYFEAKGKTVIEKDAGRLRDNRNQYAGQYAYTTVYVYETNDYTGYVLGYSSSSKSVYDVEIKFGDPFAYAYVHDGDTITVIGEVQPSEFLDFGDLYLENSRLVSVNGKQISPEHSAADFADLTAPAPEVPGDAAYIAVSSTTLYQAFDYDRSAADAKYRNRYVEVTGQVSGFGFLKGSYVVVLGEGTYGLYTVNCCFDKARIAELLELKKGDRITVRGICKGYSLYSVEVKDCFFPTAELSMDSNGVSHPEQTNAVNPGILRVRGGTNARVTADASSAVAAYIPGTRTFEYYGLADGWYKIKLDNGSFAYVYNSRCTVVTALPAEEPADTPIAAPTVQPEAGKLGTVRIQGGTNARVLPDAASPVAAFIGRTATYDYFELTGNWYKVKLTDGSFAYVDKKRCTVVS